MPWLAWLVRVGCQLGLTGILLHRVCILLMYGSVAQGLHIADLKYICDIAIYG